MYPMFIHSKRKLILLILLDILTILAVVSSLSKLGLKLVVFAESSLKKRKYSAWWKDTRKHGGIVRRPSIYRCIDWLRNSVKNERLHYCDGTEKTANQVFSLLWRVNESQKLVLSLKQFTLQKHLLLSIFHCNF